MEEQQIQEFVHRAIIDRPVREALALDPVGVIARENYSPCIAAILLCLVPCLAFERPLDANKKWWHA